MAKKKKKKKKQRQTSTYSAPIAEYRKRDNSSSKKKKKNTSAKKTAKKQTSTSKNSRVLDTAPVRQRESSSYKADKTVSEYRKRNTSSSKKKNTSAKDTARKQTTTSRNSRVLDSAPIRERRTRESNEYSTRDRISDYNKREKSDDSILSRSKNSRVLDSAPIREDKKKKKDDERTWFQKSKAFDDGYQFGDVTKTVLGSATDAVENLASGVMGMGEKFIDATAYLAPGAYLANQTRFDMSTPDFKLYEEMQTEMDKFIKQDLYDEQAIARKIITNPAKKIGIDAENNSIFGQKSDSLIQSAGQLGATVGLQALGVPWFATTGLTSFGAEAENALNQGATHAQAGGSALISAGAEILSEKLSGGISFGGKTMDDVLVKNLTTRISDKTLRSLTKAGIDAVGEGSEEVISSVFSRLGSALYKEENIQELLTSEEAMDEYIESFIGGAFLGGGSSVVNATKANKAGKDFATGLTNNELKVAQKEIENRISEKEKDGTKLSTKDKNRITQQVYNDLEKGYIDIDTIESTLGGETYKRYKESSDYETKLQQEYDELKKLKTMEMTGEQFHRLPEVKKELDELKKNSSKSQLRGQLDNEMKNLTAKDTFLRESYNEKSRRGQKFEADLSKYDKKQQAVIQNAVNSGILNNTNRTREFVDMVAKISADKGVSFDFTNNQKLKESGFAVDGKTINGYVKDGKIAVNVNSNKALNTIVGHEITHVLEGTELYTELQNAVKEYAITKGEYQARYDTMKRLYKDVDSAVIDNEVTADLVGDYLFTDADFVSRLSVEKPNVFKKIYDEIKYFVKSVTSGKEARELEKVKRAFDKAYKESAKVSKDAKYSVSDTNGKTLSKEQQDYFKESKVRDENGNLKVMYHGTGDGGFHEFAIADDGQSFFFTDNNETAKSYSGTHENYTAQTLRTADEFNKFFESVNADEYEVREENGQFVLYEDGDEVATSDTAKGIYDEFRDWTGLGTGSANYKVYLDIKNPLTIDGENNNWDEINVPSELKASIGETADTRTLSKYAKENGYDGVIINNVIDNGLYASGMERYTPSTVAIAFDSNQIKSVDNANPTKDADIRYSLSDDSTIAPERISDKENDVSYSLSYNSEIAKGQSDYIAKGKGHVNEVELDEAHRVTNAMVDVMMKYSNILPEDKIGKVLTKNGSYDRSVENTTICVRTLAYNEFVDKVQEEIGRPLTQMESFLVSQKLYDIATEPQCMYCYVSLDRKAFNDMLLRYMTDRDTVIDKYNKSDKSATAINELYEEFLNGRKDTKPMKDRFNKWISDVDNGVQLLSLADIATEERQSVIKANGGELAKQLADARKYAQSASWSKIQKNYVAYRDEILKLGDRVVKNLNEHYGLRWYSFSDYSPAFIVENMQQITDASIRGLKGLSYTKDTDYAEIFASSGMNINVSVFVNQDENGNFFIDEKQSANFERAKELREKYPNVGIVATVTNDEALRWAGSQEWSDVIIPFHIVRTGTDVAQYYKWLNYTAESADTINDKNLWDAYVDSLNLKSENARKKVSKNIYPNEHKNDKTTYLTLCENRGLTPRFARFAGEDWYMKLVNETRLSAEESVPLKPVYDLESAQASFEKFIKKGGYEGGWYKEGVDVDAEAKDVASDVLAGKQANEVAYGRQDNFDPTRILGKRRTNRTHGKFSLSDDTQTNNDNGYSLIDDDYAPLTEAEANERDAQQGRLQSLGEGDMPPEIDAPYYGENPIEEVKPFDKRDIKDVGDRKVKAYMYENPEVKPFFQEEAEIMLRELRDSTKGERSFNDQLYYDTGGEQGWFATKRQTSDEIAYLLDEFKYTYADIEKGLKAIIEDHGAENNAISKRIEFMIDERLREGYTDFTSGYDIPNNPDYIALLEHKQITEYNDEAYNRWVESLAQEHFVDANNMTDDIAPVKEKTEPVDFSSTVKKDVAPVKGNAKQESPKVKGTTEHQEIARILSEEPKTESQRNNRKWAIFKANVFDKGTVFEDLSIKKKNRELMGKWNYTLYSEARAQRLMGNGNPESNVKSLNAIREEVESTGLTKQFYEYMYHKHNVDRMNLEGRFENVQNKPVFGYDVTSEMSQEIVDQYEFAEPRFIEFAEDVYNYQKHLRQQLVDNGVISQKTADLWQKMYPHYVPIRRVDDTGLNVNVPLDTGRTGVNAPIKRATGGNSDILPLFDTMGMRTMQTFKATAKNSFGVELKNTLGGKSIKAPTTVDELIDSIDAQDSLLQEGKNGSKPTFTVFENGERVTFEITEDMYDALKPVSDSSFLSKTIKPLNIASNIHRGLLTEYNPVFMLNNAIKDVQDVLMNSQHATRTYLKIPEAHKQMITKGYWYNEYMANGGEQNTYFDNESNTFATEKKGMSKALDIFPLKAISKANNYIEMIPRLAEYIASRESGRSVEVSMLDSARVTTNFRAGGDLTKFINRNGGTFLNASVQGAMQQVRNVREANMNGLKGWANLATKFAVAGVPAFLLNNMLWDDDEDYEELSDYVKQSYYVVGKYGDGQFIRIPKGRTVAVIQEGLRQMENLVTGNDEADLKSYLEFVVSNLAPNNPLENNILAPIMQVAKNETWYGEDLVPSRLQDLPANEQFDESTDSFSRKIGDMFNISPIKVNYLLDQYSGGIGDVVLPMLTPEAESGDDTFIGNMLAPLKKKFTTDSVMNNQNVSDFYALSDKLALEANKSSATEEDILRNKYLNSIKSDLSDLYAQKRELQNSGLSNKEKYEQVREIQRQIDELTKEALSTYDSINVSGRYATIGDKHFLYNEENGWRSLTDKQVARQQQASELLDITAETYWDNEDDREAYDWAVKYPDYYQVSRAISDDVLVYWKHNSHMWNNIRADKDENGKSIPGTKKEKIIDYINEIDDMDYEEKIVLFKKYYPADDTYNYEIIDYLNSRDDISYEEMETILKELEFEVDEDGNIYW